MATSLIPARTVLPQLRAWPKPEKKASLAHSSPLVDSYAKSEPETSDFFSCLSEASLKALHKIKHTVSYPAGAIIFSEGRATRGVYILCRGLVKILTTNRDGRTLILKIAKPGEALGLNSVISGKPYELTAEILQPSELTFIARTDYLKFITEHTDACLQLVLHLSHDCESANDLVRSIGLCQPVPERLARVLLKWSANATTCDGIIQVKLGLTHEELAGLIGASRETVTRTLSEFKRQHIIEMRGSTLLLCNRPALESIAGN